MNRFRLALVAGFAVLNATFVTTSGHTCSRVLWNDNKLVVVVGRTMDWPESTEPMLTVFPRGMKRDGGRVSTAALIKDNPAKWT